MASAEPEKSLSTASASLCSCSDSEVNSCCASTSCCTDWASVSSERDTLASSVRLACCCCRLCCATWASCRRPPLARPPEGRGSDGVLAGRADEEAEEEEERDGGGEG